MTEKELNGVTFDWSETLEALCSNGFSQFLGHRTEMEFDKWRQTIGNEVVENIAFYWGASKLVIVDEDNDWVLKIPFCDKSRDYCAVEAENYKKAVEAGVEEPFAACYFLMEYEGAPCYVMEKINCDEQAVESDFLDKLSGQMSEDEISDCLGSMDTDEILDQLLEFYYEAGFLQKINAFLSVNSINDLHTGNLGYRGDKLVLVDYSGYYS